MFFTKPDYWDTFLSHYLKLRPDFTLDSELLRFYVDRRSIEDIWEFINTILENTHTNEQLQLELDLLSRCCNAIDDTFYAL